MCTLKAAFVEECRRLLRHCSTSCELRVCVGVVYANEGLNYNRPMTLVM